MMACDQMFTKVMQECKLRVNVRKSTNYSRSIDKRWSYDHAHILAIQSIDDVIANGQRNQSNKSVTRLLWSEHSSDPKKT